jgi:lipopolysaccharide export system protein LptA
MRDLPNYYLSASGIRIPYDMSNEASKLVARAIVAKRQAAIEAAHVARAARLAN